MTTYYKAIRPDGTETGPAEFGPQEIEVAAIIDRARRLTGDEASRLVAAQRVEWYPAWRAAMDAERDAGCYAEWDAAFTLGTMSGVRSIRAALPMLRAADWARIVTLSAHSIQRQSPRLIAYTASKAALSSVTKNLSKSLAKEGILVNCVCPGTIVTASFTENLRDVLAADGLDATDPVDVMTWIDDNFHHPCDLGRAGLPEEIASITTYLASKRNGYVTGATVNVDGGSDFI